MLINSGLQIYSQPCIKVAVVQEKEKEDKEEEEEEEKEKEEVEEEWGIRVILRKRHG